jgi:hypothetical protein
LVLVRRVVVAVAVVRTTHSYTKQASKQASKCMPAVLPLVVALEKTEKRRGLFCNAIRSQFV